MASDMGSTPMVPRGHGGVLHSWVHMSLVQVPAALQATALASRAPHCLPEKPEALPQEPRCPSHTLLQGTTDCLLRRGHEPPLNLVQPCHAMASHTLVLQNGSSATSSSTQQERWPHHPFVSTDHRQHWEKLVRDDEKHNLGLTREQKGNPPPAQALREVKFPTSFSLPVGSVRLHSFLSLSPSRERRGHASQRPALTPGQERAAPEPRPGSKRQPQPGYQATGKEDQCRAQQQWPPTAGLARILETHVRWRERKKAAEYPHNCC